MIKFEKTEVVGLEPAIRGMRNPRNSWDKSDSRTCCDGCENFEICTAEADCAFQVGPNDLALMKELASGGPVHAKYRRMIAVYVDITAPLYWWKEFDTYKVGTVANSCSTMHKIHEKEFTLEDFSHEHLMNEPLIIKEGEEVFRYNLRGVWVLNTLIGVINTAREMFLKTGDKRYWWQMIQLLPSSYKQKRTVMLNYEVLADIYPMRKDHKLDEWQVFCRWIEGLPYSEVIIGKDEKEGC